MQVERNRSLTGESIKVFLFMLHIALLIKDIQGSLAGNCWGGEIFSGVLICYFQCLSHTGNN